MSQKTCVIIPKCFCIVFVLCFSLIAPIVAQEKQKTTVVIVPSEIFMPSIVVQPDSPIRIEAAVVGKMLDGKDRTFFKARNMTNKPISYLDVYVLASNGTGFSSIFPYKKTQGSLAPGEVAPPGLSEDSVQFILPTESLIQKLRLRTKMRLILFFMVVKVEFEDGTIYDATRLLNSLEEHVKLFSDKYDDPTLFQSQPRPK